MRVLFTVPGKSIFLADQERMILAIDQERFYDLNGSPVPAEEQFLAAHNLDMNNDPWESYWMEYEGIEKKLLAESVTEIEWEIDDGFGKFGFKNRSGEFVIEPQYAFAHQFTYGLAAVNLNRTWYRDKQGQRVYENHYGFINERGETVIPFAYDEANPFNQYGVAVVEDRSGSHLIDTSGSIVHGTQSLFFDTGYEYTDRFLEFYYAADADKDLIRIGIYDSKERRILQEPAFSHFFEYENDLIQVFRFKEDLDAGASGDYFISTKGDVVYPWLMGKGFCWIEPPNRSLRSIVAVDSCDPPTCDRAGEISGKGKTSQSGRLYGLYSEKERFVISPEYDTIREVADNLFGCSKDGMMSVIQVEPDD